MKRFLLILFVALAGIGMAQAQSSMTDDQVLQFVIKEHNSGTSQAQIVTKLMQKGVDINQIRRIRQKYERQMKNGGLGVVSDESLTKADNTLRSNNGDPKKKAADNKISQRKKPSQQEKQSNMRVSGNTLNDRYNKEFDEEDEEYRTISGEMDFLFDDEDIFKKEKETESLFRGHKVFGRDIFNKEELTFEPNMNIATPQSYVVGPGDNVKVDIYGASQKSNVYTVSPDGDITIEGFGPVTLSGLTVSQAQARLRSTLGSRYSSSSIKLSLGQTRTITVNVMGEVIAPGSYTLSAFANVFHALYMAGGVSEIGTLRNIKVFRNGRLLSLVDVYDYILNGKMTGNVRLADGDVIMVGPYDCIVNASGKVKRPMYYEMKKNESLGTMLKYAGGFASDAYTKSVRVVRKNGARYSVFNVGEFDANSFYLSDGDSISVDSIIARYENMVELKGAVFRPGMYQIGGDISSVRSLLEHAEGLKEEAFTARAVMHRMNPDRTLKVVSVDVEGIMSGKVADIPLQNEDVLFIPTRSEMQLDRTITIHGEVQYPGVYRYADNETLEDFVLQAGGLKETASTVKVDVARRVMDAQATKVDTVIAQTFTFALKEGFVVDGEPGFVLMPYDEVYVRRSPGYYTQQNVTIEGEVAFPGNYTLTKRNERLSDVVRTAGGTNAMAYIKGARLERRITSEERLRMEQVVKMTKMQNSEGDSIDVNQLDLGETYYIGIELDKALAYPGSDYDVVLREGDRIIVPEYINTIKVSGNVMYPNTISYKKGKGARYYVRQAGGFGQRAKKNHTYIVHMNGTVSQMGKGEKPTPGCEIIVPTKPKADANKLTQWLAIGTSTASIATMIATIANLIK